MTKLKDHISAPGSGDAADREPSLVAMVGVENRCLVPFTAFNEPDQVERGAESRVHRQHSACRAIPIW